MATAALRRAGDMSATREDFFSWVEGFRSEMRLGLTPAGSSLRMIPTYLSPQSLPHRGEPVIVLDAGGTNLRVALMEFGPHGPEATYFETVPMLGTQGRLTVEEFYDGLAGLVAPIAHKSRRVGFCFSFPCEILPSLDGRILHFDKEVDIPDAAGSILGDGLRSALARRGLPHDHRMVVINDTVAAMLGAMAQEVGGPGEYMGFILGTGTNICAPLDNAAITKAPDLAKRPGSTIINLESGGYDKLTRTATERAFDATTANPGDQVLEKLISGAYQGPMAAAHLRSEGIDLPGLTAKQISEFLEGAGPENPLAALTAEAQATARQVLELFFRRAARLTAATLAAVLDAMGTARDPQRPVNIAAEGTTFYKCPLLHRYLLEDMESLVAGELGLYSRFVQGENPNLTGAALAALAEG